MNARDKQIEDTDIKFEESRRIIDELRKIYLFSRDNPGRGWSCGNMIKDIIDKMEGNIK